MTSSLIVIHSPATKKKDKSVAAAPVAAAPVAAAQNPAQVGVLENNLEEFLDMVEDVEAEEMRLQGEQHENLDGDEDWEDDPANGTEDGASSQAGTQELVVRKIFEIMTTKMAGIS